MHAYTHYPYKNKIKMKREAEQLSEVRKTS